MGLKHCQYHPALRFALMKSAVFELWLVRFTDRLLLRGQDDSGRKSLHLPVSFLPSLPGKAFHSALVFR